MTIKEYLNSKEFKNDYQCWYYDKRLVDEQGNELSNDKYQFYDDEKWEEFISNHNVIKVERGWELGDDHEMYAFAKIFVELKTPTALLDGCKIKWVARWGKNGRKYTWFCPTQRKLDELCKKYYVDQIVNDIDNDNTYGVWLQE